MNLCPLHCPRPLPFPRPAPECSPHPCQRCRVLCRTLLQLRPHLHLRYFRFPCRVPQTRRRKPLSHCPNRRQVPSCVPGPFQHSRQLPSRRLQLSSSPAPLLEKLKACHSSSPESASSDSTSRPAQSQNVRALLQRECSHPE